MAKITKNLSKIYVNTDGTEYELTLPKTDSSGTIENVAYTNTTNTFQKPQEFALEATSNYESTELKGKSTKYDRASGTFASGTENTIMLTSLYDKNNKLLADSTLQISGGKTLSYLEVLDKSGSAATLGIAFNSSTGKFETFAPETTEDSSSNSIVTKGYLDNFVPTGSGTVTIKDATDSVKGIVLLSDTASSADAATGHTALTPKALQDTKTEINNSITIIKEVINNELGVDIDNPDGEGGDESGGSSSGSTGGVSDTQKGTVLLSDALDRDDLTATSGGTAATPKAIFDVKQYVDKVIAAIDKELGVDVNDPEYNPEDPEPSTSGGATDSQKGTIYLSDAIDRLDLTATSGSTAATPKAVALVKGEIGDLDSLITTNKNNVVAAINEIKANSGGGSNPGDITNVVLTPNIVLPVSSSSNNSRMPEIVGSAYLSLISTDLRYTRVFQLAKDSEFTDGLMEKRVNADYYKVDTLLDAGATYYVRIKDISNNGYESTWSKVISFSVSAEDISIATPVITLKGYMNSTSDFTDFVNIFTSPFTVEGEAEDTHKATSWDIVVADTGKSVYKSLNDTSNLTSFSVPEGTLTRGTTYRVLVTYHGNAVGDSETASKEFTTSSDFGSIVTPTITISGMPNNIPETPTIAGSSFFCTRGTDTHTKSDWLIYSSEQPNDNPIYQSLNDTSHLTSINITGSTLQKGKSYVVKLRYHGEKYGWSSFAEYTFTVATYTSKVVTPSYFTVTGEGYGAVPKFAYMAAAPFAVISDTEDITDTHQYTDWQIFKTSDLEHSIWESLNNSSNTEYIKIPEGTLEENTEYLFRVRFKGNKYGWSNYAEKTLKTVEHWEREDFEHICPNAYTQGIHFIAASTITGNFNMFAGTYNADQFVVIINGEPQPDLKINFLKFNEGDDVLIKSNGSPFPHFNTSYFAPTSSSPIFKEFLEPLPTLHNNANAPTDSEYNTLYLYGNSLTKCTKICNKWLANNPQLYQIKSFDSTSGNPYTGKPIYNTNYYKSGFSLTEIPEDLLWNCTCLGVCYFFAYQTQITSIPEKLFKYNPLLLQLSSVENIYNYSYGSNKTFWEGAFCGCEALRDIPSNLFAYNPKLRYGLADAFFKCNSLTNITGTNILGYKPHLQYFCRMFTSCDNLLSVPNYLFNTNSWESGLLTGKHSANSYTSANFCTWISGIFDSCSRLSSLPEKLLHGLAVQALTSSKNGWLFSDCPAITSLPSYLLGNNPEIKSIRYSAIHWTNPSYIPKFTSFPSNLLSNNANLQELTVCIIAANDFITSVGNNIINNCPKLKTLNNLFYQFKGLVSTGKNHFLGCSSLSSCTNMFRDCIALTSIEDNLFDGLESLTSLSNCFQGCTAITEIPNNLFLPLNNVTACTSLFPSCTKLTTVPKNCLLGLNKVTNLSNLFSGCVALTEIPEDLFNYSSELQHIAGAFANTNITSIPSNLLYNIPNVTHAYSLFDGCAALLAIPKNLFINNKNITELHYVFRNCTSITEVPIDLFRPLKRLQNCNAAFSGCLKLAILPVDLLKYNIKVTSLEHMFNGCTSLVPSIKIGSPVIYYNSNTPSNSYSKYFAVNCAAKGTVYIPTRARSGSSTYTTYNAFNGTAATNNVNIIKDSTLDDINDPEDPIEEE